MTGPIDLYARLGLTGPLGRQDVLNALDSRDTDPVARRAAAFILCDESRRQQHDDWWRTMSTVSLLRSQLSLNASVLWTRHPVGDFSRITPTEQRIREATPRGPLTAIHAAE